LYIYFVKLNQYLSFIFLKVRAVNVTMRAFQKAGQFQLSSVNDGILARRRYTKKSTDSCSSTSSSTTTSTAAVVPTGISPSTLPHTRRLCGNGVCRCRHAACPPTNDSSSSSSFDFSDERLSQLIDQYPLTTTAPPKRYGMTLRSRVTATTSGVTHEFASPAPPPPLLVPSLSSSSSSSSIITDVSPLTIITGEKRPLTSPIHHSVAPVSKKLKRSGTITIDD
jgi:hypothetical protein